jgi:hypothetical protein
MHEQPTPNGLLDAAERYAALALPIIPLRGKIPAIKHWQTFIATQINLRFFFGTHGCNIGLRTGESGYVVLDTDTPEADAWVKSQCPPTPMQVLTGSGSRHRYYRNPPRKEIRNRQGLKGINGLDVRGHGGYVVLPPSRHPETGRPYAWDGPVLTPEKLPRFSPAWVYRRTRQRVQSAIATENDPQSLRYRGQLYVAKFDRAISGQGGHTTTLKSAFKILRFVGFDVPLAWELMQYYNATRCDPPWNEKDLKRKLTEALRLSSR